jgi:hypothetical protein
LMAALVPVGILLGPMVMPFVWFKERVDPAVKIAPVGAAMEVEATVESSYRGDVSIALPKDVKSDEDVSQQLLPIRETLERLLVLYRQGVKEDPSLPWEVRTAERVREASAKDLEAYLKAGVPAQTVRWTVRPPENADGRYPIALWAGKQTLNVEGVIGNRYAPGPAEAIGVGGMIRSAKVSVPSAQRQGPFLQIGNWDIGWIWLYVVVYLPLVFGLRALLKVA